MTDNTLYQKAESRIDRKIGFYKHFTVYCVINIFLVVINYLTNPNEWWCYFVTIAWGIGVICHFISVFGLGGLFNDEWRENKIDEEMKKMKK